METLETDRLRLRPWTRDDFDVLHGWTSDPRMMTHMGRPPLTRGETRAMLERTLQHYDREGFGVWIAEDRAGGEPVGRCGLSYHRAWPDDPEAGWWIAPEWQGRDLATEAGRASVAYAFDTLGVDRVVSICIEENVASRRVMAKLGFEKLTEVVSPLWPELVLWIHARSR